MLRFPLSFADRLVDDIVANDSELNPIYGYQHETVVSLERALQLIEPLIYSLSNYMKITKERCYYPNEHGLTND